MPGFREPKRTALLVFEGDYSGAQVRVALNLPMRTGFEFQRLRNEGGENVEKAFKMFGDLVLVDWNVEDEDGKAVPASGEGFITRGSEFCNLIIQLWGEAVAGVPKDSEDESTSGGTSAEESAPTAASSRSRQSSRKPK